MQFAGDESELMRFEEEVRREECSLRGISVREIEVDARCALIDCDAVWRSYMDFLPVVNIVKLWRWMWVVDLLANVRFFVRVRNLLRYKFVMHLKIILYIRLV